MTKVKIISSAVREGDFVARWGGEEFIIALQSTNKEQATTLAEKIRKKVEGHTFKVQENRRYRLVLPNIFVMKAERA